MNAATAATPARAASSPAPGVTREDVARHYDQLDRFYRDLWGEHVFSDDGYAPSAPPEPHPPLTGREEPPYFLQVLEHLKERQEAAPVESELECEVN